MADKVKVLGTYPKSKEITHFYHVFFFFFFCKFCNFGFQNHVLLSLPAFAYLIGDVLKHELQESKQF